MATIAYTKTQIQGGGYVVTWASMATDDVGLPVRGGDAADRSVQVTGTFGGASAVLEGSNDLVNYATLSDPQANALSLTSAALKAVSEAAAYMRPRISGGAGVSITVSLFVRG